MPSCSFEITQSKKVVYDRLKSENMAWEQLPAHVRHKIDEYVTELHLADQRERFSHVLHVISVAGVSPNEDLPDLLDIHTAQICEGVIGWSQRVSEAMSTLKSRVA